VDPGVRRDDGVVAGGLRIFVRCGVHACHLQVQAVEEMSSSRRTPGSTRTEVLESSLSARGDAFEAALQRSWIPAFAGMTA
jgi:hypothetical protein